MIQRITRTVFDWEVWRYKNKFYKIGKRVIFNGEYYVVIRHGSWLVEVIADTSIIEIEIDLMKIEQ